MIRQWILISTLYFFFILTGCDDKPDSSSPSAPPLIKSIEIYSKTKETLRQFPGKVIANKQVELSFQISGKLIELPIHKGMKVKKNTLLAKLDPRDYEHGLAEQEAMLARAKLDLARSSKLLKTATISQAMYDQAKERHDVAKAKTLAAKKAVDDTNLTAPFPGVIASTYVDNFEFIKAKQRIASLQNLKNMDIEIHVPEQDIISRKRQTHPSKRLIAAVKFPALPGRIFPLSLKEFSTDADSRTQTYAVIFTMPTPKDINLLPGMTANVMINIPSEDGENIFYIPLSALVTDSEGKHFVWVVRKKVLTVHKQMVSVDKIQSDKVRILGGLKDGERVVTAGLSYLNENMKVRIMKSGDE